MYIETDYLFRKCFSARFSRNAPMPSPHPVPRTVREPHDFTQIAGSEFRRFQGFGLRPKRLAAQAPEDSVMGLRSAHFRITYLFWKCFSARFSRKAPMPSSLSAVPQQTPKASASKAEPVTMSVCMPIRMQRLDS